MYPCSILAVLSSVSVKWTSWRSLRQYPVFKVPPASPSAGHACVSRSGTGPSRKKELYPPAGVRVKDFFPRGGTPGCVE